MTRDELANTIASISFGTATVSRNALPADSTSVAGFPTDAPLSQAGVESLLDAVTLVAPTIRDQWVSRLNCTTQDEVCARRFIEAFGRRAFRRPLSAAELARKLADYSEKARKTLALSHADALAFVVKTVLLSPSFLYRAERASDRITPDAKGWVALDGYEVASRLSYALWQTMPDDALLDAAEAGELAKPEGISKHAQRMIRDPQFKKSLSAFLAGWAGIAGMDKVQKDASRYPTFTKALADDLFTESMLLGSSILFDGSGSFRELVVTDRTFVNQRLAEFYGLPGIQGSQFVSAKVDGALNAGVLTRGAFLAAHALPSGNSPPRRAKYVAQNLLCAVFSVPQMVDEIQVPVPKPNETTRQSFETATTTNNCVGCHRVLNPLGFAFEMYDAVGLPQRQERGVPIDSAVEWNGQRFEGAPNLIRSLAAESTAGDCVATQWFRFFFARPETDEEVPTLDEARRGFSKTDLRLPGLLEYYVTSNSFRFRLQEEGE
jgi:hypothetical protein